MNRRHYLLISLVLFFLFVGLLPHYYVRSALDPYVTILSNTNEAFIYFGRSTIGESGSMAGILFRDLIRIYPTSFAHRDDFIVAHVASDGNIEKADIRGLGFSGSMIPESGSIYYLGGSANERGTKVWRWDSTTLVELADAKAFKVVNSFTYISDLIKKEGWKETRIRFNGADVVTSFPLGKGKCELSLMERQEDGNISQEIKVRGDGIILPERVIANEDGVFRSLSKQSYNNEIPNDE